MVTDFQARLEKVLNDRAANKKAIARLMDMPYATFLYKCKSVESWNVLEFDRLSDVLRLSDEEKDYLCGKVK